MKNRVNCQRSEKGYIAIVPIVPLLWGMAFLAIAFILYPFLGIWGLVIILVVGLVGMWVGLTMIKSASKEEGKDEESSKD